MKIGLVMEGGAMRGMFTAGVTDVFMEHGITFDGAVGVSAGATFGCNVKSGQIGRTIRYNCKYCNDYRFGSMKSLLKTGNLFDVDFCYHEIPYKLDIFDNQAFLENPMEFYVVATDMKTGGPKYVKLTDALGVELEWIRASASIPLMSKIVAIEGGEYLDGGISDSVPLAFFKEKGYEKNVVILTRPEDYRKKKNSMTWLCRIIYRKYPRFVDTFANRHLVYNKNIAYIREEEKKGNTFVICPSKALDVSSAEKNPDKLRACYEEGRKEAERAIEERGLLAFLNQQE